MSSDINARLDNILSNTQGLSLYFDDVKVKLNTIISNLSSIKFNLQVQLSNIAQKLDTLVNNSIQIVDMFILYFMPNSDESMIKPEWDEYLKFPAAGWINFWSSFTTMSLEDFILNIVDKIETQTNPLHEDNVDDFNATLDLIKSDTFIGSFYIIADETMPTILSYMKGSNAILTFSTAGVSTSHYTIPPKTITIDMSWYLPFKPYGDMVISGFMLIGYFWLLFKRGPDILNGVGMITDTFNQPEEPDFTTHDNITVDDNGIIQNHSTTYRYKSGYTVTQKHDLKGD